MPTNREKFPTRLPDDWQAPPGIQDRLGSQVGRQRALIDESLADGEKSPLLLVLHDMPEHGRDRQGLFFWRALDNQWQVYCEGEAYDARTDGLLALEEHLVRYEAVQEDLRAAYERARRARHYLTILEDVALKRHAAENLYRTMEVARGFMRDGKISYDIEIINLRDRAYNLEREFELLYQDTQNALDYREAHAVEILNLLILIFFPLSIISSIFQTGITEQILTLAPALDPLIMTICLLAAALLLGIGLYLLISPSRRQHRTKAQKRLRGATAMQKQRNREPTYGLQVAVQPNPKRAQRAYQHPLAQWRLRKRTVTLDKNMAHYAVDIATQRQKKKG